MATNLLDRPTTALPHQERGPRLEQHAVSGLQREQFDILADWWHEATDQLSSPDQIAGHQAYQRIIAMGKVALPFIFEDLQERGGQWYRALREITHESPVPPEAAGNIQAMKAAWLHWAKTHHYLPG